MIQAAKWEKETVDIIVRPSPRPIGDNGRWDTTRSSHCLLLLSRPLRINMRTKRMYATKQGNEIKSDNSHLKKNETSVLFSAGRRHLVSGRRLFPKSFLSEKKVNVIGCILKSRFSVFVRPRP